MTLVRVYLPMSPAQVRALASTRSIGPVPLTAYAVTPELRSAYPQEDQDGWEYHARRRPQPRSGRPGSARRLRPPTWRTPASRTRGMQPPPLMPPR